ncbi:MAG: phage integrase SAM-like domain-containing protein, partial [Flavobacteriales bacterium]|nr:phage integrase SAM-like domain-containing protein [Flavobacteriales bacterium]
MAVSANVILRSKPLKKDGTGGLYLRFVLDRKKKDFSLGESIPPSAWDDSKAIVKTRTKTVNAEKLNLFLSKELARANDIILEHKLDDREITIDRFTAAFQGESKAPRDLYEFVRERIIDLRDGNYAYNTIRKYETELSKLKKFRPSLTLKGVDYSFLRDYESYMRNELGNKTNTVQKSMATLRAFINVALKEGLLKEYPFSKFPLRKEASTRLYLT